MAELQLEGLTFLGFVPFEATSVGKALAPCRPIRDDAIERTGYATDAGVSWRLSDTQGVGDRNRI